MHKILLEFDFQTDHQIPVRKPDQVKMKKKQKKTKINKNENLLNRGLCCPGRPQGVNKRKRKERQVLGPSRELKNLWNIRVTGIPIVIDALGTVPKDLIRDLEELKIGGQAETIQNIRQNICYNLTKRYWMRNNQKGGRKWNGNLYNINKIQYSTTACWR